MCYKILAGICALIIIKIIFALLPFSVFDSYPIVKIIFFSIVVFVIIVRALSKGADLDNAALLKRLSKHEFVRVTHRGKSAVIDQKIRDKIIKPYGPFASSYFQRLLGKKISEFIDGKDPVIWVSSGRPFNSCSICLGKIRFREWDKAITFKVRPSKLKAPDSFFKKMFGKHQLVVNEEIPLNGEEEIYTREKITWHRLR